MPVNTIFRLFASNDRRSVTIKTQLDHPLIPVADEKAPDGHYTELPSLEKVLDWVKAFFNGVEKAPAPLDDSNQGEPALPPRPQLTATEERLLRLLLKGKQNKEAANEMKLSVPNTEKFRNVIMNKFNAKNAVQLGYFAAKHGF